ncbi:MAG: hypothetical protein JWN86_257 [Planctomycetota bacterium]|nr:hypothetical protein [Planctomycetota bacterium]
MIASFLLAVACIATAQTAPTTDAMRFQAALDLAKKCGDATVKGDFATVLDLTHPDLIKAAGGREVVLKGVNESMTKMKEQGVVMEAMKAELPKSLTRSDSGCFAIIPVTVQMTSPGAKITAKSFLVGFSSDDGKTWTFLDGTVGEKTLRKLVPSIPKELEFPPKVAPKVERTESDK